VKLSINCALQILIFNANRCCSGFSLLNFCCRGWISEVEMKVPKATPAALWEGIYCQPGSQFFQSGPNPGIKSNTGHDENIRVCLSDSF